MASLYNRNGNFYAQFFDNDRKPKQKRHSLGTTSKRVARKLLSELEEAEQLRAYDPWIETPSDFFDKAKVNEPETVGPSVKAFLSVKEQELRLSTFSSYESVLNRFASHVGESTFLARVTEDHVESFIQQGDAKATTQRTRLATVQSFLHWSKDEGKMQHTPTDKLSAPRSEDRVPKAVSEEELDAICEACSKGRSWMTPVWRFAYYTGMRMSEIARLEWDHVDFDKGLVYIHRQKNGKAQTIPLNSKAKAVLEGLEGTEGHVFVSPRQRKPRRTVKPFVVNSGKAFKQAREAAGIERRITPHGLRHAFCSRLAEAGRSAFVIQAAARHANVSTSQRYVSISNRHLKAEIEGVF